MTQRTCRRRYRGKRCTFSKRDRRHASSSQNLFNPRQSVRGAKKQAFQLVPLHPFDPGFFGGSRRPTFFPISTPYPLDASLHQTFAIEREMYVLVA